MDKKKAEKILKKVCGEIEEMERIGMIPKVRSGWGCLTMELRCYQSMKKRQAKQMQSKIPSKH